MRQGRCTWSDEGSGPIALWTTWRREPSYASSGALFARRVRRAAGLDVTGRRGRRVRDAATSGREGVHREHGGTWSIHPG